MKDHTATLAGLAAIIMILGAAIVMTVHGIKEDALLIILLTGAVEIGKAIVGIKTAAPVAPTQPEAPKEP
jgi:hypothetical protein